MSYHQFRHPDGDAFGSFEVFQIKAEQTDAMTGELDGDGAWEPGFYWWPCFPGCLPDGDERGPFATESEAIEDAQKEAAP